MKKVLLLGTLLALAGCNEGQTQVKISGPILLIGDSIRQGYQHPTRDVMPCIEHEMGNSRDSGYLLQQLPAILSQKKYAVIHFNVGLWDISHRDPTPTNPWRLASVEKFPITTTPEQYQANLELMVQMMKELQPQAVLVFATTTDVPENSIGRSPEDVDTYNSIAEFVMWENGVAVDDLNGWMKGQDAMHLVNGPNKVHYSREGYQLLAEKVTDTLQSVATCPASSS